MNALHHQIAAAQRAYDNRSPAELSRNEEDFLERTANEIAESLGKAITANFVVTDLTDKFAEVSAKHLFRLMHLAETGQAAQLLDAVKAITTDCVAQLSDYQAERAYEGAAVPNYAPKTIKSPRFAMTHCSQCGSEQGPGDSGVSHCSDHRRQA